MELFETKDGKKITYQDGVTKVYIPEELLKEKKMLEAQLAEAVIPTDKELLSWAKANYPMTDYSATKARIEEINTILTNIKEVA